VYTGVGQNADGESSVFPGSPGRQSNNISPLKCVKYHWEVKILTDKDRRVKEEEEDKECNTDVDKNNLAFAAMGMMLPKDSIKKSKPRQ